MPFDAKPEKTFRIPVVTWTLIALCAAMFGWQCLAGRGTSSGIAYPGYVDGLRCGAG